MRRLLLVLVVSAMMAMLLATLGSAAAQVATEPPRGTGPTGGDAPKPDGVGSPDSTPTDGVADLVVPSNG